MGQEVEGAVVVVPQKEAGTTTKEPSFEVVIGRESKVKIIGHYFKT